MFPEFLIKTIKYHCNDTYTPEQLECKKCGRDQQEVQREINSPLRFQGCSFCPVNPNTHWFTMVMVVHVVANSCLGLLAYNNITI